MNRKYIYVNILMASFLIFAVIISLCVGRYNLTPIQIFNSMFDIGETDQMTDTVLWTIRMPRIAMAIVIGAGLSVSGASLQSMFGNPLVSSHILGVSASAGFGAALGILLFGDFVVVQLLAIVFGFFGMFITYSMGRKNHATNVLMLVLSGIVVTAVFEALISLVKYVADPEEKLPAITYWLMGSLAGATSNDVVTSGPLIMIGILMIWLLRWRLNIMSLREDEALSLGINLKRSRALVVLATTIIAAITVSVCGIIAFVGLAVPHISRMLVGNDNKYLIPTCFFTGGVFMVIIDTLSRSVSAAEIPLSILTAIIGAPIFAILLRKTGGVWSD